ncbi:MAG: tetratricopeptide repeat protein [Thermodesulfobacteriota bacterium]
MLKRFAVGTLALVTVCSLSFVFYSIWGRPKLVERANEAFDLAQRAKSPEDLHKAAKQIQLSLHVSKWLGEKKNLGSCYFNLALINDKLGEYAKAVEYSEKARTVGREMGDPAMECAGLKVQGDSYSHWGDYEKARKCLGEGFEIKRRIGDIRGQGAFLLDWGSACYYAGRFDEAERLYRQALDMYGKVSNVKARGQLLMGLGNIRAMRGKYFEAAKYYEESLNIARQVKDLKGECQNLNGLAVIYKSWGQYAKAVECSKRHLAISREIGDLHEEGMASHAMGVAYWRWGQYREAFGLYERALTIARERKDIRSEGQILQNMGNVCCYTGQFAKATEYLSTSVNIRRRIRDVQGEGEVFIGLGNVSYRLGRYAEARAQYERALEICQRTGDRQGERHSLVNLGNVSKDWGLYGKAAEYYHKSLELAHTMGDAAGEGENLMGLGGISQDWGQYAKTVGYFRRALDIRRKIADVRGEVQTLLKLGNVYEDLGQHETSVRVCEQARELCERSLKTYGTAEDTSGRRITFEDLASAQEKCGRYAEAVECFDKALGLSSESGDVRGEARTLLKLGKLYCRWGRSAEAVEHCERSLAIYARNGEVPGQVQALHAMAGVYADFGDYANAMESYEKLLALAEKTQDMFSLERAYVGLGLVCSLWGRCDKAVQWHEKALDTSRKSGEPSREGRIFHRLGYVHACLGEYSKAAEFYEKALEFHRKGGDLRSEGSTLLMLGRLLARKGQYTDAVSRVEEGLNTFLKEGVPVNAALRLIGETYLDTGDFEKADFQLNAAHCLPSLGRLELTKGNHEAARKYYDKMLKIGKKNGKVYYLFAAHTGLGAALEGLQDYPGALAHYTKASEMMGALRSRFLLEKRGDFFDRRIEGFRTATPHEGLARVLMLMNRPGEALKYAELKRAYLFSAALPRWPKGQGFGVPHEILQKDSDLIDRLTAHEKKSQDAREREKNEVVAILEQRVKTIADDLSVHLHELRKQYPLFAATKYPHAMELDRTVLKEDEWALSYSVTDSGLLIFLSRGNNIVRSLFKPIRRQDLDELVRKFMEPLEIGTAGHTAEQLCRFDFTSGRELASLLLGDTLADLPNGAPLIVVPDDCLGVLPFEMLVLNDQGKVVEDRGLVHISGAEFFGDRNPISYSPSLTALTPALTPGRQRQVGDRILVVAEPAPSEDERCVAGMRRSYGDHMEGAFSKDLLMAIQREVAVTFPRLSIASQIEESVMNADPTKTDVTGGAKAKSMLFEQDLSPYRSLIFAVHGYLGKNLPRIGEPALAMSLPDKPMGQDGFMRLSEVMALKLNADLVVLPTCRTGLGMHNSGEGAMGMARAFQYAGARSILITLWTVDHISSINLLDAFFRYMRDGKSKREALALAKAEIRKSGYDHPFFWAPFILGGDAD